MRNRVLMFVFSMDKSKNANDMYFKETADRTGYLKETEENRETMSTSMEDLRKDSEIQTAVSIAWDMLCMNLGTDEVFKRVDEAMYENKSEMKAARM